MERWVIRNKKKKDKLLFPFLFDISFLSLFLFFGSFYFFGWGWWKNPSRTLQLVSSIQATSAPFPLGTSWSNYDSNTVASYEINQMIMMRCHGSKGATRETLASCRRIMTPEFCLRVPGSDSELRVEFTQPRSARWRSRARILTKGYYKKWRRNTLKRVSRRWRCNNVWRPNQTMSGPDARPDFRFLTYFGSGSKDLAKSGQSRGQLEQSTCALVPPAVPRGAAPDLTHVESRNWPWWN